MGNVQLVRNGDPSHPCTYLQPLATMPNGPVEYYEVLIKAGDTPDWLFVPDQSTAGVGVSVSFPYGTGSAVIEASDSPPSVFSGNSIDGRFYGVSSAANGSTAGPIIFEWGAFNSFGGTSDNPMVSTGGSGGVYHGVIGNTKAFRLVVKTGQAVLTVCC